MYACLCVHARVHVYMHSCALCVFTCVHACVYVHVCEYMSVYVPLGGVDSAAYYLALCRIHYQNTVISEVRI